MRLAQQRQDYELKKRPHNESCSDGDRGEPHDTGGSCGLQQQIINSDDQHGDADTTTQVHIRDTKLPLSCSAEDSL